MHVPQLIAIDSKIITFKQVGPDISHFIDLRLAIGDYLVNMQIKKFPWLKFSTPGRIDDSSLYRTQINQNINFCMNFQAISKFCLTTCKH